MAQVAYRYAPVWHMRGRSRRYIGALVHAPQERFFALEALAKGDLMRRLGDVSQEEVELVAAALERLREEGEARSGELGLLESLSPSPPLGLGPVRTSATRNLSQAVHRHFREYVHPDLATLG